MIFFLVSSTVQLTAEKIFCVLSRVYQSFINLPISFLERYNVPTFILPLACGQQRKKFGYLVGFFFLEILGSIKKKNASTRVIFKVSFPRSGYTTSAGYIYIRYLYFFVIQRDPYLVCWKNCAFKSSFSRQQTLYAVTMKKYVWIMMHAAYSLFSNVFVRTSRMRQTRKLC